MNFQSVLLVGAAGFVGTLARYGMSVLIGSFFATPGVSTLVVNILGSFAIGYMYGTGNGKWDNNFLTILTVGLLGGFTTFSAFSAEAILYLRDERWFAASSYIVSMVGLGLFATFLGFLISK